jgi:hypothetical protein
MASYIAIAVSTLLIGSVAICLFGRLHGDSLLKGSGLTSEKLGASLLLFSVAALGGIGLQLAEWSSNWSSGTVAVLAIALTASSFAILFYPTAKEKELRPWLYVGGNYMLAAAAMALPVAINAILTG